MVKVPIKVCPCDDEDCDDVHNHDVTGTFTVELPPLETLVPDGE